MYKYNNCNNIVKITKEKIKKDNNIVFKNIINSFFINIRSINNSKIFNNILNFDLSFYVFNPADFISFSNLLVLFLSCVL
jgi:hypothetical protein